MEATSAVRSALELLPDYVKAKIASKDHPLRDDLRIIPEAEAAGWTVTFRNDAWHNPASFDQDGVAVWSTGYDWRSALYHPDGSRGDITTFAPTEAGLRQALGL